MSITFSGQYIPSGVRQIEIFDVNANQSLGTISLGEDKKITLQIRRNGSGYGNIKYRNLTNKNDWINASLLSDGAEITP